MVSDHYFGTYQEESQRVLILVLMEYGLWPGEQAGIMDIYSVLILVLMEYGLWRYSPAS